MFKVMLKSTFNRKMRKARYEGFDEGYAEAREDFKKREEYANDLLEEAQTAMELLEKRSKDKLMEAIKDSMMELIDDAAEDITYELRDEAEKEINEANKKEVSPAQA